VAIGQSGHQSLGFIQSPRASPNSLIRWSALAQWISRLARSGVPAAQFPHRGGFIIGAWG